MEIKLTDSFSQKALSGENAARPLGTDMLLLEEWEAGFRHSFDGSAVKLVMTPWGNPDL